MVAKIARFVRSTSLRRRLWCGAADLAVHALAVGTVVHICSWLYPSRQTLALGVGLGWLGLALVYLVVRRGMSLRRTDGALGLQDRLITWWSLRERRSDAMTQWLEADLSASLDAVGDQRRVKLWRRPMRRLLVLVPLLLLVWWIGPLGRVFGLPSPIGVTEEVDRSAPQGGPGTGTDGPGKGDSQPGEGDPKVASGDDEGEKPQPKSDESEKPDPKSEPKPRTPKPKGGDEEKEKNAAGSKPPPNDPREIPDLPTEEEFVIPKFIGDEKGKTKRVRVAVVEEGEESIDRSNNRRTAPLSREQRAEFEAAAERAIRARLVPPRERAFVRRYFDALLERRPK